MTKYECLMNTEARNPNYVCMRWFVIQSFVIL